MQVSYLGSPGSFHHLAAHRFFGPEFTPHPCPDFDTLTSSVASNTSDFGVLAIENSIAGSLLENYDFILLRKLHIVGEVYLRVSHNLLAHPSATLSSIRTVTSHPMALKQCRQFLTEHPSWSLLPAEDTATAAAHIALQASPRLACIASTLAAEIHSLTPLATQIETNHHNYTHFFILSASPAYPASPDKTSLVFTLADAPGALARTLMHFADQSINLTKIESRPILGRPWEYYFYLNFSSGLSDPSTQKALKAIKPLVTWLKVLGTYRSAPLPLNPSQKNNP